MNEHSKAETILNTREAAILIWLGIGFMLALFVKGAREVMPSILKQLLASKLTIVVVAVCAYVALMVWGLAYAGVWSKSQIFETLFWLFGPGIVLVGRLTEDKKHPHPFRRYLRDAVALSVIVEFVVGLRTFALPVEMAIVFVATLLSIMLAASAARSEFKSVETLLNVVLTVAGVTFLALSIVYIVREPSSVFTLDTLRDFSVPLLLTIGFLPLAYLLAWLFAFELLAVRVRWYIKDRHDLRRYALRKALRVAGLRVSAVRRLTPIYNRCLYSSCSKADIDIAIKEFHQPRAQPGSP